MARVVPRQAVEAGAEAVVILDHTLQLGLGLRLRDSCREVVMGMRLVMLVVRQLCRVVCLPWWWGLLLYACYELDFVGIGEWTGKDDIVGYSVSNDGDGICRGVGGIEAVRMCSKRAESEQEDDDLKLVSCA